MLKGTLIYNTNNQNYGDPDFSRLRGLAKRLLMRDFNLSKEDIEKFAQVVDRKTLELEADFLKAVTQLEGGICGGMVCNWALNYLSTDNPEIEPETGVSRLLQGDAQMTVFKRQTMSKIDEISVARKKMYQKFGQKLNLEPQLGVPIKGSFPSDKKLFMSVTGRMIREAAENAGEPYLLSVVMGGKHAIGLLYDSKRTAFYILDPNLGLYRYATPDDAKKDLKEHFASEADPGSEWQLIKIRKYST